MNNVRTFPACKAGLCNGGRHPCPTPHACQTGRAEPLAWLTPGRFWIGYLLGFVSGIVGLHVWASL